MGEVRERGATVLLTTHYMEEAEAMCDRLAIMGGGRILAVDSPRNLVRQIEGSYAVRLATAAPLGREVLAGLDGRVELVQADENNAYLLRTKNDPQALQAILAEITNSGAVLERLEITPVTLEDVFLKLTGRQSDGQGAEGGPC
jgi:ABC-2 type transport system ATP-binding protein